MSPHMVTGELTGCTVLSSSMISCTYSQRCLRSPSEMSSHFRTLAIQESRSPPILGNQKIALAACRRAQGRAKVVPEESGGATVYVAALGVALVAIKIACAFNDR